MSGPTERESTLNHDFNAKEKGMKTILSTGTKAWRLC